MIEWQRPKLIDGLHGDWAFAIVRVYSDRWMARRCLAAELTTGHGVSAKSSHVTVGPRWTYIVDGDSATFETAGAARLACEMWLRGKQFSLKVGAPGADKGGEEAA